jgi:hypothetical protein
MELDLDALAASCNTCWIRSNIPGQNLSKEMAARVFLRAFQISKLLGLGTKYVHAYFTLSQNEEREEEFMSAEAIARRRERAYKRYEIFRDMGLEEKQLAGKKHLGGYSGWRYFDHLGDIDRVVGRIRENWRIWFYQHRVEKVYGKELWGQLKDKIDWQETERKEKNNEIQNIRAIRKTQNTSASKIYSRYRVCLSWLIKK